MSNKELYKKLKNRYGKKAMAQFSIMLSEMYDIVSEEVTADVFNEALYERDWWMEKYKKLTKNDLKL